MDRKRIEAFSSINQKANRILYVVFLGLTIICARLWYLCIMQHEARSQEANRTRRHLAVEPAMRGTIRDRFHIIMAANAIEYRVGIAWTPIQEIPRKIIENGEKRLLRKEYVKALAAMLAKALNLSATHIEDIIYSHAVFSQSTPVIIKTGLTESEYYRLNGRAKDWPGLVVERSSKRVYPRGRIGCHVIGYTAPLNRKEFDRSLTDIRTLKEYVDGIERGEEKELPAGIPSFFAAKERLLALERRAYGLNDEIGKMGVEATFESQLRGLAGKKYFITNAFGEHLRETAGSTEPIPGKRLVLSLSSELQSWCEQLLAESEEDRAHRLEHDQGRLANGAKNPFLRGGAIVAINPKTAEVIACASYPRFDPNDFVRSTPALCHPTTVSRTTRWLEGEPFIQKVWDLEWPLMREMIHETSVADKELWMTWDNFLSMVLPTGSPLIQLLPSRLTIGKLLQMQNDNQTDAIFTDISRLVVRQEEVSAPIAKVIRSLSIDDFRSIIAAKMCFSNCLKKELEAGFQEGPFLEWRDVQGAEFLNERRLEEKTSGRSPRPFLTYLERECARQFTEWWQANKNTVLVASFSRDGSSLPPWVQLAIRRCIATLTREGHMAKRRDGLLTLSSLIRQLDVNDGQLLFEALKGYDDLTYPLAGHYSASIRGCLPKTGQDLIRSFLSMLSPPLASFCHMQPSAQGSIFKLVVAHAALRQQIQRFHGDTTQLNPNFFRLTDRVFHSEGRTFVGLDSSGKPIPQLYKGGRIPRSADPNIGAVDFISAIARSSNPYFSLLASEYLDSPTMLEQAARTLGYGEKTGIALPSESSGHFPNDLLSNTTGVYTTAVGQHTLTTTPLQSAVMLSALANGGDVIVPRLVRMAIGAEASSENFRDTIITYQDGAMRAIGLNVPVWLSRSGEASKQHIQVTTRRVKRHVDITNRERDFLFSGMSMACDRAFQDHHLNRLFAHRPGLLQAAHEMHSFMIGKSSTAESYERLGLGLGQKPYMYNHTWFGGIFFPRNVRLLHPFEATDAELVVVVFLRYGTFGKDAAPLAASVLKEWKNIRQRHQDLS
jgi:cell division protein FtsI/penicillin-binding protein 2